MGDRYYSRGTSKFYAAATAPANLASVTNAELLAAVDFTVDLADWTGFEVTVENRETPDLATRFTTSIVGAKTTGTPSVTIYERLDETTFWDLFAENTPLWIIFLPEGNPPASGAVAVPAEVWPMRVSSRSRTPGIDSNRTFVVTFAVVAEPNTDAVVVGAT